MTKTLSWLPRSKGIMEKVDLCEVVKLTEEVESAYNQVEVLSPKKRKRKSQEEGEVKPKKPRSAYLLYYFDVHQIMQQEKPNQPQSEINKRISESWKRLSVAEKRYYLDKANSEKDGTDTLSSPSPSKDLPGFRKILPRASYLVLTDDPQAGGSLAESLNDPGNGNLSFPTLTQELKKAQTLGLACKVDVSQRSVGKPGNTGEMSYSAAIRGCTSSSSSITSVSPTSKNISFSLSPVDVTANCVQMKECEIRHAAGVNSGVTMHQTQGETTQMVAIIPNENMLEPKSLAGVSPLGPLMMVSVAAREEPSYKMAVKTYTRRGRGKCLNPHCSFIYVTRHKPTKCPECGRHLGGKWIPTAKKTQQKNLQVSKLGSEVKSGSTNQDTVQEENADAGKTKPSGGKKEGQRCLKKIKAIPGEEPAEGSSKSPDKTLCVSMQPLIKHVKEMALKRHSMCNLQGRPVRPILPSYCSTGPALFQIITVPTVNRKIPTRNIKAPSEPRERFSGLKADTLKQLGREVQSKQESFVTASQLVSSPSDMTIVSVVPFNHATVDSFKLGLSTARGRGHCKNALCDYMYKNRHKPLVCPKCGCKLTRGNPKESKRSDRLVDPYQPLSPVQKDIQRQSTLQLIRRCLQIPESEAELQETLVLIQDLNGLQIVLVQPGEPKQDGTVETETLVESGWPQFYESSATHCVLCKKPLYKGDQSTIAGQEDCWLLTEMLVQTASLQLKVCLNARCLAMHSFTDLHPGAPSVLVRLIHDGELRLDKIEDHSEDELRNILQRCGASITPCSSKNDLLTSLISMCTLVHSGLPTGPQAPENLTAGKLSIVCPHKIMCGSKYLVRGETARDHVDLLVSSRYWPPVYVGDSARQVALCTDMQYPEMAARMWGRNQGCFSEPFDKPEFVSCAELHEKPYNAELSTLGQNEHVHPLTKSSSCWLVHPPDSSPSHETAVPEHHSMALCKDLEHLICTVTQINKEDIEEQKQMVDDEQQGNQSSVNSLRTQRVLLNNPAHYYLYNRLLDFLSSRDIVTEQINQVLKVCQPGEVVIRDALYRLGVANINLEREEGKKTEVEELKQGTETAYEVVLPE
ncbi:HMG domain-containing protein 3 isoform X8 [Phyllopteryx taeniolatus]|uniref:HMG domain-containing protein 3 isoform X8 n=1 Tax=Phyllopteryx taeniolatus TaxID=161469 RepID=UPI002AD43630|nr:HMG domain-containing protein 3 isoform X8 [Phyllopteryx taeniolatus]